MERYDNYHPGLGHTNVFGSILVWSTITSDFFMNRLPVHSSVSLSPALSNGQTAHLTQLPLPNFSPSQISTSIDTSPTLPLASPVRQRNRRTNNPVNVSASNTMGIITVDDRFLCTSKDCNLPSFSRLADLRRHYEQQHAKVRTQLFCPYIDCPRGAGTGGGNKGRSFGNRKDKRAEHIRNKHKDYVAPQE
ncbi:hypothetical protein B0J11DRAFT_128385 [Dendryphion nanum]|uniref:C2H2-type domain-containing protein n=1 Tax=Dendryphion nanum TaxID=256645 RepID=A0A9P9D9V0_9PLEO|nr:hypothetical protein B0J11DRAFT_128385 [Dendryphion nanum]